MPTFLLIFCVDFPSFCQGKIKRRISPISGKNRGCPTCFDGTEQGGFSPPVPPRQGHRPWTQSAKWLCVKTSCFRMKLEERKSAPTGAMRTEKRRGWIQVSSSAFFAVFPGCFASGQRRSATGPWAGASGASNSQSYNLLLQRVFACFVKGRRQSLRPYGPAPFTQGRLFLHPSAGFSSPSGILCQQENVC